MLFRKKVVEEKKHYPYRNNISNDYSVWDGMSIIEKFAMIFLPCMMCFVFYTVLEITELVWWLRLVISIGIVSTLITLIWILITWLIKDY